MQSHRIAVVFWVAFAGSPALIAQASPAQPEHAAVPPAAQQQPQPQSSQPQSPQPSQTQQPSPAAESKLTFEADTALWTVAIRPDKTADFERVMQRLREALMKSDDPARRRQGEGWKVVKLSMPLPDGNIGYVHVINPVVPGADYTVMQILYDAFPDERQMLYELYRGAFASNLALATGNVVVDLGMHAPGATPPPTPGPATPAAPPTPAPTPSAPNAPTPPTPPAPATPGR
jgi:hypothetical protein